MDDLISRNAALALVVKAIHGTDSEEIKDYLFGGLRKELWALPSAQPGTARRIVGKSRDGITLWYQCDMCNEPVDAQDNFCSGCGRRLTDG